MFKTLYCCPRTIARHENGHLYESRCAYLEHLAAQGSSRKTLRVAAEVIYRAAVYMRLDSSSPVERSDVERAAKDWATRPYGNGNQIGPERVIKRFRLIVCGWLRFAGRLHEPDRAPGPHQGEVACLLSLHGRGTRSFASHHRDSATPSQALLRRDPETTTHAVHHRPHRTVPGRSRRKGLDAQRDSYAGVSPTGLFPLCRKPKMDKTWARSSDPGAAHLSEGASAHGSFVARC
jgi:hypothetical protein